MKAILALEDGSIFIGRSFGAGGETTGEVVFNTSMTGYQEILTDPSYAGQIVAMTYPMIGNYGMNAQDDESAKPRLKGFIVREGVSAYSNWRATESLEAWLVRQKIVGIQGIDTRALTKKLRTAGSMKGIISTTGTAPSDLVAKAKKSRALMGQKLVKRVTTKGNYVYGQGKQFHVVAMDFGVKTNILRSLEGKDCKVTVAPADTAAADILGLKPDGIFLSNGPGDPQEADYAVDAIGELLGKQPIFGICLGHQLIALALGASTYKLKFGHHGANQPVKNLETGHVEITSQNHGYAVDADSLPANAKVTHINLNDNTNEGLSYPDLAAFSVQYHPEAAPGPHDAHYLFDDFIRAMNSG